MSKAVATGKLVQDGQPVADVATIHWTVADGKRVAWTGWLTLADNSKPLAAGRFTLELPDGTAGPVLLMGQASAGEAAPFCNAPPVPRCKPARG